MDGTLKDTPTTSRSGPGSTANKEMPTLPDTKINLLKNNYTTQTYEYDSLTSSPQLGV